MKTARRIFTGPFSALLLAVALLTLFVPQAAYAVGTAAGDSVTNGYFAGGDTIPQTPGRLSIAFTTVHSPSETSYNGPAATLTQIVDTAYDLAALNQPADSNTAKARDTASYGYTITNRGNTTLTIDVAAIFSSVGSDTNWGSNAYKVFNDLNNDGTWDDGDAQITSLTLAADATDTVVMAVLVPASATDDDSSGSRFFVTDRAQIVSPSVTGDLWENGAPISGNDAYDTQYDTVTTRVIGPNVRVTKSQTLASGRARPGDTLIYAITFDNDGADSAAGLVIYDAVPQNGVYVPNSADSAELVGSGQGWLTAYDDTYSASNFNDTGNISAKVIRWTLTQPLGATSGDDKSTVQFTGNNDAGRVYFKARIQ